MVGSIYYEFLLQMERIHKFVEHSTAVDDFNTSDGFESV